MNNLTKGTRFFIEFLAMAFCVFVFLIAVGQIERFIGLTPEVTSQYSIFVMLANFAIVYFLLNEIVYRAFPFKFFRRRKFKRAVVIGMIVIPIIILGLVYFMGT